MNMDALEKGYGEDHEGGCIHEDRDSQNFGGSVVLVCLTCGHVFLDEEEEGE